MPGSRDLITYDDISSQPEIPVETWGPDMLTYEGSTSLGSAAMLDYDAGSGTTGDTPNVGTVTILAGEDANHEGAGALAITGPEEFQEYLQSQGPLSYDTLDAGSSYEGEELDRYTGFGGSTENGAFEGAAIGVKTGTDSHDARDLGGWRGYDDAAEAEFEESEIGDGVGDSVAAIVDGVSVDTQGLDGLVAMRDLEYDPVTPSYGLDRLRET